MNNVYGLTAGQALLVTMETRVELASNIDKNSPNPIDQLKLRNFYIASMTVGISVIVGVAVAIFSAVFFLGWMGLALLIFSICGTPIAQGILVASRFIFNGIEASLNRYTVEPYRKMKNEIELLYPTQDDRDQSLIHPDDLIMLMEKSDTNVRAILIKKMNFDQLKNTESILSRKCFKQLILNEKTLAHKNWKRILKFDDLKSKDKIQAIANGKFRNMLENNPEAIVAVRERIYKSNDQNKSQLIKALDDIAGLNDNHEFVYLKFSDAREVRYPRNWIRLNSEIVKNCNEGTAENVIPIQEKHSNLVHCFDILKGMTELPNDTKSLNDLANTANYYGLNLLSERIGRKMIQRFRNGELTKIDLITWLSKNVPNEPMFASLRKRAILLTGFSKINILADFNKLWSLVKGWNEMHDTWVYYLTRYMKNGSDFRSAYNLASELNSSVLKGICLNYLAARKRKYKIAVQNSYLNADMPLEVRELIE